MTWYLEVERNGFNQCLEHDDVGNEEKSSMSWTLPSIQHTRITATQKRYWFIVSAALIEAFSRFVVAFAEFIA